MVDTDTCLTTLDVMGDAICPSPLPAQSHYGPQAALTRSEVVTLGLCGPWACVPSDRARSRDAQHPLRAACPTLPPRPPCNRLRRRHCEAIVGGFLPLVARLRGRQGLDDALDRAAVPPREAKRRGAGWRPGLADSGGRQRLGWYEGFHLRIAVHPYGVLTGVGVGPARAKAQRLAEPCLARRRHPHPACQSVGRPALGPDGCDQGCAGLTAHARWWHC